MVVVCVMHILAQQGNMLAAASTVTAVRYLETAENSSSTLQQYSADLYVLYDPPPTALYSSRSSVAPIPCC